MKGEERSEPRATAFRSDSLLGLTLPAQFKLLAVNAAALGVIWYVSGTYRAVLVLLGYTLATHAYIKLLDRCQQERRRLAFYAVFLLAHVVTFLWMQHAGMIGILNVDNASTPKTMVYLVGVAFYILQAIGICGAVYRRVTPPLGLGRYALAISFSGCFLAGPLFNQADIKAFTRLEVQLPTLEVVYANCHFLTGALFFKLVLANWLAQFVDVKEVSSPLGIARSVACFELQVYFDFAGYSLLVLFARRLFGIPNYFNFRHPFAAKDIPEFWRRWHVGLGAWFKENVFIPLRGVLGTRWAARAALPLAVFLASAAWHGPTLNFLAWGLFHGLAFVIAVHLLSRLNHLRPGRWLARLYVFIVVFYGRLIFMDSDAPRLLDKFNRLGFFKVMALEVLALLSPAWANWQTLLMARWDDVVVAVLIALLLGYEIFHPKARGEEPYLYFRPGPWAIVVFVLVLVLLQPVTRPGFVYGR